MKIIVPTDGDFDFYSCRKLYYQNQKAIGDDAKFNQIIKNTLFFSFYDNKVLVGCIYLYKREEKLFFNGFAKPKFHMFNLVAVEIILKSIDCDIYAESIQKPAIYVLLRCGFKRVEPNIFMYKKMGKSQKGQ